MGGEGPSSGRRVRGRTLVVDGRRSVVDEGGAEVDLQGTVTAGRGRAGHRGKGGTVRVRWTSKGRSTLSKVVKPKEMPHAPLLHGSAVGSVPTVNLAKRVVREVCEGACRTDMCRVSVIEL